MLQKIKVDSNRGRAGGVDHWFLLAHVHTYTDTCKHMDTHKHVYMHAHTHKVHRLGVHWSLCKLTLNF